MGDIIFTQSLQSNVTSEVTYEYEENLGFVV